MSAILKALRGGAPRRAGLALAVAVALGAAACTGAHGAGQTANAQTAARQNVAVRSAAGAGVATRGQPGVRSQDCVAGPPTPAQTEGPYFKAGSPERTSLLEAGVTGTRLVIGGRVLTTDCQPVVGAMLDWWQADDAGRYDNSGYRLRGHEFTDAAGRYRLETVVPGLYPGRTRHIHVKVQAPGQPALTTQVYFPDEPANRRDGIFDAGLTLAVQSTDDGVAATFDFILAPP